MKPLVTICCITYNHEKYISQTIESFLMQKRDFPIEIIIHDDASTDKTTEIIKEYERKYPEIIKPIYQKENQYSKSRKISFEFVFPKAQGKYISFCEGDDFWVDQTKLKKQVEFMELHDEYSMCFHAVKVIDFQGNPTGKYLGPYTKGNKDYRMDYTAQGGAVHLSSIFFKTHLVENIPTWALNSTHGDYALAIMLSALGKVHFIDEVMSYYRRGVKGSATTKLRENFSKENELLYHKRRIRTLNEANAFYDYKFSSEMEIANSWSYLTISVLENRYLDIIKNKKFGYVSDRALTDISVLILNLKIKPIIKKILKKIH